MTGAGAAVSASLEAVRRTRPLVHNITNIVVTNVVANALLAIGASPAMVEAGEEVEELAAVADALVVNLGTLSSSWAAAMKLAVASAGHAGTPWTLDPVAVGVLGYRTRLAHELLAAGPAVIRGNAAEVMALAGVAGSAKGVDSLVGTEEARDAADSLARRTGAVVAVTGVVDIVTDGSRRIEVANGDPMMAKVTGTGCVASAIVGAFAAVGDDRLEAVAHGLVVLGVAGELAALRARGPGSFQAELLDGLHGLDAPTLADRARLG